MVSLGTHLCKRMVESEYGGREWMDFQICGQCILILCFELWIYLLYPPSIQNPEFNSRRNDGVEWRMYERPSNWLLCFQLNNSSKTDGLTLPLMKHLHLRSSLK